MIEKIVKRDGRVVPFDPEKITMAIYQAAIAVGGHDRRTAEAVTADVLKLLESRNVRGQYPTVEEVQDLVEQCLIKRGHDRTAKAYIIYRYEHSLKRAGEKSLTYSSDNIPYRKLWQALSWGLDHGYTSLKDVNRFIVEGRFSELVTACEAFYGNELENALQVILPRIKDMKIIIISGPSSSGKTTTTIKIGDALKQQGYSLTALNVDNYYFDLADQPKDSHGDYDYETPQAIDLALINRHLKDLLSGREIEVPFYNFKTGNREGISGRMKIGKKDIILIDSLHGMFDEMTEGIPDEKKFRLYIETLAQLKGPDGRFLRWTDMRMLRRMVRDMQFRNYKPEQTLTHWHYVRRSELRYIVPRLTAADVIVNSAMAYELPIMKHRLGHLFPGFIDKYAQNPDRQDALERAQRVQSLFEHLTAWEDESVVPERSLMREFIGGSAYTY
ncbi:MAG: hypothetical protein JW760_01475 [Spirochaetales bacterium]|nr:hypothetical protein [Spirochaetales bacterium]